MLQSMFDKAHEEAKKLVREEIDKLAVLSDYEVALRVIPLLSDDELHKLEVEIYALKQLRGSKTKPIDVAETLRLNAKIVEALENDEPELLKHRRKR